MVRFLIIRLSSIGDVVLTTPVIRYLKNQVPKAEIHFLVKPAFRRVLEGNPYIHQIHEYDKEHLRELVSTLQAEGFDYIIDLQKNLRSASLKRKLRRMDFSLNKLNFKKWLLVNFKINRLPERHIVDRYLDTIRLFDVQDDSKGLDFFLGEDDEVQDLPSAYAEGYVLLAYAAAHETKKIPLEYMAYLIDHLQKPVVLVGGPGEAKEARQLETICQAPFFNGVGRYSLGQSAWLVKQARVVITPDTGLMHIAAAFRKIILSVWGNTVPAFGMSPYRPHPDSQRFERTGLACRPCSKIGHAKCPKKHFKCMLEQDYDAMIETCNKIY